MIETAWVSKVLSREVAYVDASLEDLIPTYMERRRDDVEAIREALQIGDWPLIERKGHQMKGSGAGYGFDKITELGMMIEDAASRVDGPSAEEAVARLERYLAEVDIFFVEEL